MRISSLALLFVPLLLTPQESPGEPKTRKAPLGPEIWKLSILQGLDAFGGGLIPQALISFWFYSRFHAGPEFTGPIFSLTYLLAAISFLAASAVCKRFGLLNTMVFTHLPCSLALCFIPLMPTAFWGGTLLVVRSLFSSMDIPARQAYMMVLFPEEQRIAVAGLVSAGRSIGQCAAPILSGVALASAWSGASFGVAGGCKSFYDIVLYLTFRKIPLHHQKVEASRPAKAIAGSVGIQPADIEAEQKQEAPRELVKV